MPKHTNHDKTRPSRASFGLPTRRPSISRPPSSARERLSQAIRSGTAKKSAPKPKSKNKGGRNMKLLEKAAKR